MLDTKGEEEEEEEEVEEEEVEEEEVEEEEVEEEEKEDCVLQFLSYKNLEDNSILEVIRPKN